MKFLFFADLPDRHGNGPLLSLCSGTRPLSPVHPAREKSGAETNIVIRVRARFIEVKREHARPGSVTPITAAQRKRRPVPGVIMFSCVAALTRPSGYWRLP